MKRYWQHNTLSSSNLRERTLEKFKRSQQKKEEVIQYLATHKPALLWNNIKKEKLWYCTRYTAFTKDAQWNDKLKHGSFCKYHSLCIACATRRALLQIQKMERLIKEKKLHNKNWYFIVLTFRTTPNTTLENAMSEVMQYRSTISRNYKNWKRDNQITKSFFNNFEWMVSSIEVSKKNVRHPHINLLCYTDKEIPTYTWTDKRWKIHRNNKHLKEERKQITNGSFIHYINKLDVTKNQYNRSWLGEVFKYSLKFQDLEMKDLAEFVSLQQKHQYRLLASYGKLRN